jgi:hypothetical protein
MTIITVIIHPFQGQRWHYSRFEMAIKMNDLTEGTKVEYKAGASTTIGIVRKVKISQKRLVHLMF